MDRLRGSQVRQPTPSLRMREEAEALAELGVARIEADPWGCVRWMNREAERLTGWPLTMALGHEVGRVARISADPRLDPSLAIDGTPAQFLSPRTGPRVAVVVSTVDVGDGSVWLLRDVNAERLAGLRLRHAKRHDPLTGLLDRGALEERIAACTADGEPAVLAVLDVQPLDLINRTCGHAAGDSLLHWIAARLREAIEGHDAAARIGGGRFGLLLLEQDLPSAERILHALLAKLREFRIGWEGKSFAVDVSLGAVPLAFGASPPRLLQAASDACSRARDNGGNRLVVHVEGGSQCRRNDALEWLARLNEHLSEGRVVPYAQPIIPLRPELGGGVHVEVLMRTLAADGTPTLPGSVIAAAERHGLMPVIDRFIVDRVLAEIGALSDSQLRRIDSVAINLSGTSLGSDTLLEFVVERLAHHRVPPNVLCFEITETAAVANIAGLRWFVQELGAMGCRFAIDDFGSGVSSYGYLHQLPVDVLKIDGSFVRACARDPLDRAIVESIAHVARTKGVRTVAEWVDDDATASLLRTVGIDYVQGHYFGAPRPLREHLRADVTTAPARAVT